MNRQVRTGPDAQASAPIRSTDSYAGRTKGALSPLARIDAVALSALSRNALARYQAYKEVLLAREQDESAILSSLTVFLWDLSESR